MHHLCGATVDLAYTKVRSRDAVDLGVCTISSLVYIFIRADERSTPGIHLVGRRQHVDIGGFRINIWPMLTSLQRDVGSVWYGSAQLQSPDRAHPVNGIYAVKVYSTLIHVIKGLATANFTTVPDKVEAAGRRRSQVAQLLQQLKFRDYSGDL